jgi:hypothetical protein
MPEEMKHPVILSKDFHIADLILRHIHGGGTRFVETIRYPDYVRNIGFLVPQY